MAHSGPIPTGFPSGWETGNGSDVLLGPVYTTKSPQVQDHMAQGPNSTASMPMGSRTVPRPWKPGFFVSFPWLGVCATILSLGCMFG